MKQNVKWVIRKSVEGVIEVVSMLVLCFLMPFIAALAIYDWAYSDEKPSQPSVTEP